MPTDSSIVRPLVLVADPDVEYAALISRQLEWAGYGVIATNSGSDARELFADKRPDALVLEANMRGLSGYELVRDLRVDPLNRLVPMVMISARAGKLDRDFAFTVGADEYIRKPFPCATVVARLALLTPALPAAQPIVRPHSRPRVAYAHRFATAS